MLALIQSPSACTHTLRKMAFSLPLHMVGAECRCLQTPRDSPNSHINTFGVSHNRDTYSILNVEMSDFTNDLQFNICRIGRKNGVLKVFPSLSLISECHVN